jgi:serine/threonine-protein kinase HipA
MRTANVYMNKILAGVLTEKNDGSFIYRYDDHYFSTAEYSSISLTMPKIQKEYHSKTMFPFFFNMLSEGVNKQIQSHKFKIDEDDHFGLLAVTAQSDVIGAITVEKLDV